MSNESLDEKIEKQNLLLMLFFREWEAYNVHQTSISLDLQ